MKTEKIVQDLVLVLSTEKSLSLPNKTILEKLVRDLATEPLTERRAYVVDITDERVEDVDVMEMTDNEFMFEAEEQGRVYSMHGFVTAFNSSEINTNTDLVRIIEVPIMLAKIT